MARRTVRQSDWAKEPVAAEGRQSSPRYVKEQLARYGFVWKPTTADRSVPWIGGMTLLASVALLTLALSGRYRPAAESVAAFGTIFVTLLAVVFGLLQWHAARKETSLDTFYERLESTNRFLDDWEEARPFAGPWPDADDRDDAKREAGYRQKMYVYRELDNLEYAIAKYRIGFMSDESAYRSLRTFQWRCHCDPRFCALVLECIGENQGYDRETQDAAGLCCAEAQTQANPMGSAASSQPV